jgi:hypothetical protein
VSGPNGSTDSYTAVSARYWHTCALRADGRLACWGGDGDDVSGPNASTLFYGLHQLDCDDGHPGSVDSCDPVQGCRHVHPPVAEAGPDQTLECTGERHAHALLDGSASTDPFSSAGTNDDIVRFDWSDDGAPHASGEIADAPFPLGGHVVGLTVTDTAAATATDETHVTVQDTIPPAGRITFPAPGQCLGQAVAPVVIADDFTDVCDPSLARSYEPSGGSSHSDHGDPDEILTVTDAAGHTASGSVAFVLDLIPPTLVTLPIPDQWSLPRLVNFSELFTDGDDDGASGGVVHELVTFDGCVVYDGLTYGDGDGLLLDETAPATGGEVCRLVQLCGRRQWQDPVVAVTATDCGGNSTTASSVIPGSFVIPLSQCP